MPASHSLQLVPAPGVAAAHGIPQAPHSALIDLPLGTTERPVISDELRQAHYSLDADSLVRDPDTRALTAVLAAHIARPQNQVLVGADADDLVDRAFRVMLSPHDRVLTCAPVLPREAHFARLAQAQLDAVTFDTAALNVEAMVAAIAPKTKLIVVTSPSELTGQVLTAADVCALSAAAPGALLVLDLAYTEFADVDLTQAAWPLHNVVVVRSLSKAWGLPGLGIGYAAGHPDVMAWLGACGPACNVARPAITLAHARLSVGEPDVRLYVERVQAEREKLTRLLTHLGARPWACSQANFVLARFAHAPWVTQALGALGIAIAEVARLADGTGGQVWPDARRITCPGDADAWLRLQAGLSAALAPQALLFDLHGTLSDPRTGALTCDRACLARLQAVRPLAVVTSWDRATAMTFLRQAGILDLFNAVVTCEDAPPKPDPAPVRLALQRLGVQTAWFVGDTPHDVRAARGVSVAGCGVIPVGLCIDSGQAASVLGAQRALLRRAGAAIVLDHVRELEDLCPMSR